MNDDITDVSAVAYEKGRREGYNEGLAVGYANGCSDGYNQGYNEAKEKFQIRAIVTEEDDEELDLNY